MKYKKLKYLCRIIGGGTPSKAREDFWTGDIPWVSPKDMKAFRVSGAQDHITLAAVTDSATQIIPPSSVLVVVRSGILQHSIPVAISQVPVALNQDMKALIPSRALKPDFLAYFIAGSQGRLLASWRKEGTTVESIEMRDLANTACPVPPLENQTEVGDFLDRETARIDDLVIRKERLAELLGESNLSVITKAVTHGVVPNTQLRACEAGWFRQVPTHWTIAPLYARYDVELGKMLDEKQITGDHLAPYLRNVDVQWGRINVENLPVMDFGPADRARFRLRQGDLLVCEGGEVGRSACWSDQLPVCYYQKALHRLRPTRGDEPRFMFYVMRAAVFCGLFEGGTNQNTIGHLTAEKLRKYRFPFPPRTEQVEIFRHLDRHSKATLEAIARVKAGVSLLREYRAALISAAVTGQLDLRKHEKRLEAMA